MPGQASDEELMARASGGDEPAFAELVARYESRLCGFASRMLRDKERARDAVQETFLSVYKARASYRPSEPFAPWIFRIVRNICLNELARLKRVPDPNLSVQDGYSRAVEPIDALERKEFAERLDSALGELAPEELETVLLRLMEGMPFRWIAQTTGTPESTVRLRFNRAMERLRKLIGS